MASTTDSATLLFKDITSDLLRALVTESSANQMLMFSAPLVRDFQGTKVKFNERKWQPQSSVPTPGLVANLLKTPFSCALLQTKENNWERKTYTQTIEPLSHASEVQNAHCQTGHVSDQVQGLVCHDRSKIHLFPCLHPSQSQEVPDFCFQGRSLPISGYSLRPSTLTPNFHEVCGCCSGSSASPGHPHTQLHRQLVDFSSFRADGGWTSRYRSRSYERVWG